MITADIMAKGVNKIMMLEFRLSSIAVFQLQWYYTVDSTTITQLTCGDS